MTAYTVDHASGAPAYALRLQLADRVVAYSGDTAWTETLLEVARDADPFICEAYGFDKPIPYHLDFRTLEAQWERLGCRSIVLTHMGAEMLRRAEAGAVDPDRGRSEERDRACPMTSAPTPMIPSPSRFISCG